MAREFGFRYDGTPVFEYVQRDAPSAGQQLEDEFYLFVMGPYTIFDARKAYHDGDELSSPFVEDPLFDRDQHLHNEERTGMEAALADLCAMYRRRFGVRAFLATDIDIPTVQWAENEPGMPVLTQLIAYSAVSDAVVFIFTQGGLTTGVGAETGAVLGEFNLRRGNPEPIRKPRDRFRIFRSPAFGSASIDEIPHAYDIIGSEFDDREGLIDKTQQFLTAIERNDPDGPLSVFDPYK